MLTSLQKNGDNSKSPLPHSGKGGNDNNAGTSGPVVPNRGEARPADDETSSSYGSGSTSEESTNNFAKPKASLKKPKKHLFFFFRTKIIH